MSIFTILPFVYGSLLSYAKNLVYVISPMIFTAGRHHLFDESKYRIFDIILMVELGAAAVIFMIIGVRKIVKYMRKRFDDDPY